MITITLTPREAALLLANGRNDHESWSDIADKIRAAQPDEPQDWPDEPDDEQDTSCHCGHPDCGAC